MCDPAKTAKTLLADMRLNMVLPCRISVFTDKGKTMMGFVKPVSILSMLPQNIFLMQIAKETEDLCTRIIDLAK